MYLTPITRSRVGRMAWSFFRYPVKGRELAEKHERLITAAELMRYRPRGV